MGFQRFAGIKKVLFIMAALLCCSPIIDPPFALLLGFILSLAIGHPFLKQNSNITNLLLKISVVGLGFGMNMYDAAKAGKDSILLVFASILVTVLVGFFLGKVFQVPKKVNMLISCATAICGGSAIAVMAPVIKTKKEETSIALAVIFLLNSIALFLFPFLGKLLALSQIQFGWWAAIAIHDTSSVIGAAQHYGEEAFRVATTVKLARTLWIIPLSLMVSSLSKARKGKLKIPYFIFLFIFAMIVNTSFPEIQVVSSGIVLLAKKGLVLTLFLIGAGLTNNSLDKKSLRPLLQGLLLWLIISSISL